MTGRANPHYRAHLEAARELLGEARGDLEMSKVDFERGAVHFGWDRMLSAYETLARASSQMVDFVMTAPDKELKRSDVDALQDEIEGLLASVRMTLEAKLGISAAAPAPIELGALGPAPPHLRVLPGGRTDNPAMRQARALARPRR